MIEEILAKLERIKNFKEFDELKFDVFHSATGLVTTLAENLKNAQDKKSAGIEFNQIRTKLTAEFDTKEADLSANSYLMDEEFDETFPADQARRLSQTGNLHPFSDAIAEITKIFGELGFVRRRYQEVDTDFNAFEGLNIPPNHPARGETETFYISDELVMTPHTSNGQLHEMQSQKLPIRMINISRCARRESSPRHIPNFHQFEGLLIDTEVNLAMLKGILEYFAKKFFGPERVIRLRPYDFQFTEPSFELDVSCGICNGTGVDCRFCKGGWVELGGAGMVHPNVLRHGGIDSQKFRGLAFGFGVERVFLMKDMANAIDDLKVFYQNDSRFLKQYKGGF